MCYDLIAMSGLFFHLNIYIFLNSVLTNWNYYADGIRTSTRISCFFAILLRHNRLIWLANTKWITNQVVNNLFVSRNKETHKIIKTQNKTRRVQNKWQQFWFSTQFSPTIDKLTCIHTQTCSSLHLHVFKQKKKTLTQTDDGKKEQKCFGCTRVLIVWMIVKD